MEISSIIGIIFLIVYGIYWVFEKNSSDNVQKHSLEQEIHHQGSVARKKMDHISETYIERVRQLFKFEQRR